MVLNENEQYIEVNNASIIDTLVKSLQGSIEYFMEDTWYKLYPYPYTESNNFIRCVLQPIGNEVCISNDCGTFRTIIRA